MSELEIGGITLDSTFWDVTLLVVAFLFFVLLSYLVHFIPRPHRGQPEAQTASGGD